MYIFKKTKTSLYYTVYTLPRTVFIAYVHIYRYIIYTIKYVHMYNIIQSITRIRQADPWGISRILVYIGRSEEKSSKRLGIVRNSSIICIIFFSFLIDFIVLALTIIYFGRQNDFVLYIYTLTPERYRVDLSLFSRIYYYISFCVLLTVPFNAEGYIERSVLQSTRLNTVLQTIVGISSFAYYVIKQI